MLEDRAASRNSESGQVTLMHLFLFIAFFMPVVIVSLEWRLGKAVWLRSQRYSEQTQNAVAIALFAGELLWIVVGTFSGDKLAAFVAEYVAR
jgi:hypothetical protein